LQNFKLRYGLKNFWFFEPFLLDFSGKIAESASVIEIFLFAKIHLGYHESTEIGADFDQKK
jgi:hypothetical protein